MKGYAAVGRAIRDEGTEVVYTLMGDAILEVLGALDAEGVRLYQAHHESAALAMADGHARADGGVGVCAVTWGVGLVNATLPIYQAVRAGTPLVVLTGRLENPSLSQYLEHQPVAASLGAGHEIALTPAALLPAVRSAFRRARAERRPVVVEAPHDVLMADQPVAYAYSPLPVTAPTVRPDPDAVRTVASLLDASERPVIVAGRGLLGPGARERVAAFADATGALLATTLPLRGWFHGDPYDLGLAGGYARPLARELIADADCVVGLGASLNHYTLAAGALCPAATLIQVDLRGQHRTGTGRRADAYVRGDALSTVDALAALVPPGTRYRTPAVAERIAAQRDVFDLEEFAIQPGTVDPRAVLDALDDALPDRYRVVLGGGHQRDLASMHLARWRGEQIQTTGAIGQGLALGVGVALALGDPVAVVEGDGGVLMNVQELNTLVRYDVPVLLFVMNNGALGSELYKLPVHGFPAALATIPDTDFAAVARAFGCGATTVTDPAQVADVVSGFLAAPGPYVVDVRVSPAVVGIPYRSRLGKAVR